jgi:ubiquinone/menaquinone biosynthesis C-methylase UbiE
MSFDEYLARQFSHPTGPGGKLVTAVMNRQNRYMYEAALEVLAAQDSDSVLDVGCGNGFVLGLLGGRTQARLAGIDISESMVRATARRNRRLVAGGRLVVKSGDAAHLPFTDASFTMAYSINTVYFWPDVDAAMVEVRRVLQPGGVFVNALYANERLRSRSHTQTDYRFHEPEALIASGRDASFNVEQMPVLDGMGYCLVCRAR